MYIYIYIYIYILVTITNSIYNMGRPSDVGREGSQGRPMVVASGLKGRPSNCHPCV